MVKPLQLWGILTLRGVPPTSLLGEVKQHTIQVTQSHASNLNYSSAVSLTPLLDTFQLTKQSRTPTCVQAKPVTVPASNCLPTHPHHLLAASPIIAPKPPFGGLFSPIKPQDAAKGIKIWWTGFLVWAVANTNHWMGTKRTEVERKLVRGGGYERVVNK